MFKATDKRSTTFMALFDVLVDLVLPASILLLFSDDQLLGPRNALLLAFVVPGVRTVDTLYRGSTFRWSSALGVVSVFGVGLVLLDAVSAEWIIVKEVAPPAVVGALLLVGELFGRSIAGQIFVLTVDRDTVDRALEGHHRRGDFNHVVRRTGRALIAALLVSAGINYVVVTSLVISEPGTVAFNEEVATTSLLSFVAVIMTSGSIIIAAELYFLQRLRRITGLSTSQLLRRSRSGT